ncbi:MAG: iron ABC transporter substrate-binding protein [Phycisphaeraceae bacterium]
MKNVLLVLFALSLIVAFVLILILGRPGPADDELVLYAGRSRALIEPIVEQFQEQTGIRVRPRYGNTAELAMALREAGERARADVFWAQDAGGLGALVGAGLLSPLSDELLDRVEPHYRHPEGLWVATSGRARVLAYAPDRIDEANLPDSVFDLSDERYRGRVAWAPTNASFQAFVTAMRRQHGEEAARDWLTAMQANEPRAYANNTGILEGIAAGEVDLGITNHYYLLRRLAEDPDYPVAQRSFERGDIGNLLNIAGVAQLTAARNPDTAQQFIAFILSPEAQQYFASETMEYPVVESVESEAGVAGVAGGARPAPGDVAEAAPQVDLDELEDLEGTLRLLREVGLL